MTKVFTKGLSLHRQNHKIPKLVEVKKETYHLRGGPFTGQKMPLTDGTSIKFRIHAKGATWIGCYRAAIVAKNDRPGEAKWCSSMKD